LGGLVIGRSLIYCVYGPYVHIDSDGQHTRGPMRKVEFRAVGWGDVDWIGLAKDRNRWRAVVNWVLNLWVP
jgi:hypothetical protein